MMDATDIRRRLNASLATQRDRLGRIDDQTLVVLVDHLVGLVANPGFDPVDFLAEWLFGPAPVFGGLTPAEILQQEGGLEFLKENLGQQVAGVYV